MKDGNLANLFPKHLPHFHWQKIEIGSLNRGVPDMNYCFNRVEGWIEFKKDKLSLRPEQIGWIIDRIRHGGMVRVAVRREEELLIFDGLVVKELRKKTLEASQHHLMGYWYGGPKFWNWGEVHNILTTRIGDQFGNGHSED